LEPKCTPNAETGKKKQSGLFLLKIRDAGARANLLFFCRKGGMPRRPSRLQRFAESRSWQQNQGGCRQILRVRSLGNRLRPVFERQEKNSRVCFF
jgi:hypothetical protein